MYYVRAYEAVLGAQAQECIAQLSNTITAGAASYLGGPSHVMASLATQIQTT